MIAQIVKHPWIDDVFYEKGSFIVCDQGQFVLLLKGGAFETESQSTIKESISIFCKKFYDDEFLYHHSNQYLKIKLNDLRSYVVPQEELPSIQENGDYDDVFVKDFMELKQKMPIDIQKAVLVSRENYKVSDSSRLIKHLFAQAIQMNKGSAYGFWNGEYGIIGATPEILFEMQDGLLSTEALAGTAKAGSETELLNSFKDRNEHNIVVQDVSEKLSSIGLFPKIGNTVTSQFSNIIHLRTKILAAPIQKISALSLSKLLSPTAALGGYPKQKAKIFLKETHYQKLFPKRFFGSVIGTEFSGPVGLVMIRNVQWEKDLFFIESGVGVVKESELQKELDEIKLKRKVVRDHYL